MSPRNTAAAQTPTILVVDDTSQDLEVLTALLRLEGYRVMGARDGPEALTYLQRELPDLVILDVAMPAGQQPWGAL